MYSFTVDVYFTTNVTYLSISSFLRGAIVAIKKYKTLGQLAKAYKTGKLNKKKNKLTIDSTGLVRVWVASNIDKKTKKPAVGAPLDTVVFESSVDKIVQSILRSMIIPFEIVDK